MPSGSIRLFVAAPLIKGALIPATAGQARYLGAVMRRAPGDLLRLFNGEDGEWQAEIAEIKKENAVFRVQARLRAQAPSPDLWLVFAPLKRDATDLVVQKATELGASVIQPVMTERTNSERVRLDRLALIATEAAEQCERLDVPVLRQPLALPALLADWPRDRPLAAAIERPNPALPRTGIVAPAGGLLIGPEGGFTERELDLLRRHPFVQPVSLGANILRAETAAIAGLALLLAQRPVAPD